VAEIEEPRMEKAIGERFVCTSSQTAEDEERRRGGLRTTLKRPFRYLVSFASALTSDATTHLWV
jgi:hypothetical protein